MYGTIRMLLGLIFFFVSLMLINKSKISRKYLLRILSGVIAIVLVTVLSFLPFENSFVTFESPEAVYRYYSFGKSDIALVVKGEKSDLVVSENNGAYTHYIVPRTSDGWKIGVSIDQRLVHQSLQNGVMIEVLRYKSTNEHFIVLLDTNGGEANVLDSVGSTFCSIEQNNDVLGKKYVTYFAYITDFNQDYHVEINGMRYTLYA